MKVRNVALGIVLCVVATGRPSRSAPPSGDDEVKRVGAATTVVNETMEKKLWPGKSAIGGTIKMLYERAPWATVVGVVKDVREGGFLSDGFSVVGTARSEMSDDEFDGAALDKDRWNAIVRENPGSYTVAGGALTITTEPGDIYSGDTTPPPNNFILQSADHAGEDWVIETKLSGTINGGYGQGGLLAYSNGDNWVKLNPISDAGQTRINRIELRSEVNGTPVGPEGVPDYDPYAIAPTVEQFSLAHWQEAMARLWDEVADG